MTQIPAGWYRDPSPENHDGHGQRYWDGSTWTPHVHHPGAMPVYPTGVASPYGQDVYGPESSTTPDGTVLAGWWMRVLAQVLDAIISLPLTVLAATPIVLWQWDSIHHWFSAVSDAANNGTPEPSNPPLLHVGTGPWFALTGSVIVASYLYQVVFLLWKQATPGKMIVGLRVRLREAPNLPAGAVFARLGITLLIGFCGISALLDYLWPLWDDKRQALHDKVAKTNVVRTR
ncbi:MAG TPA: RDD family protein [Marmoricola sp.]|jgi:uncharacterized RDD family membrane protein YckC|nr:RDD family protein [Marmoricola sp.]